MKSAARKVVLVVIGVALLLIPAGVSIWFAHDMRGAYARLAGRSEVLTSSSGQIEFARGGQGVPVLVIHGSGGGFDQGALLAKAVLDERFSWLAPSRFGYLRSNFRAGASFDDQAHAYAELLDQTGIQKVAVVALSHGGPSALLFALLHPERVSSLTLISCGVAAVSLPNQEEASAKGNALVKVYQHDFLYWAITRFLRAWFLSLMGANAAVVAEMSAEQKALVDEIIDGMNPSSPRAAGAAFDNQAAMPNERIAGIRAPTLVVHASDDSLQLFQNAEYARAKIPQAKLLRFERGGHLVLALEQASIREAVQKHILLSGW